MMMIKKKKEKVKLNYYCEITELKSSILYLRIRILNKRKI